MRGQVHDQVTERGARPADDRRYVSLLGDRREAPVPCVVCRAPTLALDALCDRCAAAGDLSAGRRGG